MDNQLEHKVEKEGNWREGSVLDALAPLTETPVQFSAPTGQLTLSITLVLGGLTLPSDPYRHHAGSVYTFMPSTHMQIIKI